MNQADEILKRYGLELKQKNYHFEMKKRIDHYRNFLDKKSPQGNPEQLKNDDLLQLFAWTNGGIHIQDENRFKQVFEVDKFSVSIPLQLSQLFWYGIRTSSEGKYYTFENRFYKDWLPVMDKALKQKEPQLLALLKGYRMRLAFDSTTPKEKAYEEIQAFFEKFTKELNETPAKKQLDQDIQQFLIETYGNPTTEKVEIE